MSPLEVAAYHEYRKLKRIYLFKMYRKYMRTPHKLFIPREDIMFIENVSLEAIKDGFHFDAGDNAMLIQIVDPDMDWPVPKYNFKVVCQFKFLDVESHGLTNEGDFELVYREGIKDNQAQSIADALLFAKANSMNVIVHCHAGICRSGAVVECGVALGFEDTKKFRAPNLMVKHKVMSALGLAYDPNETPEAKYGKFTVSGIQYF